MSCLNNTSCVPTRRLKSIDVVSILKRRVNRHTVAVLVLRLIVYNYVLSHAYLVYAWFYLFAVYVDTRVFFVSFN